MEIWEGSSPPNSEEARVTKSILSQHTLHTMYNEFHPQQHVLSREMLTFKSTSSEVTEKRPLWSTGPFWEDAFVFSSVISLVPVTVFKGRDWLRFKSIGSRRKVRHNLLRQKRENNDKGRQQSSKATATPYKIIRCVHSDDAREGANPK